MKGTIPPPPKPSTPTIITVLFLCQGQRVTRVPASGPIPSPPDPLPSLGSSDPYTTDPYGHCHPQCYQNSLSKDLSLRDAHLFSAHVSMGTGTSRCLHTVQCSHSQYRHETKREATLVRGNNGFQYRHIAGCHRFICRFQHIFLSRQ